MNHAIETNKLVKRFPKLYAPALDNISVNIKKEIITGLVGPDGSGKTTLIRIYAGLLSRNEGDVVVLGKDPYSQQEELKSSIGYMPQRFGLYEDLSVIENLNLYANLKSIQEQEKTQLFNKLLTFTDLKKFTSRASGKLSGGMKQKLGLACALIGEPKLLLLDEPSVGVDPISRQELWKLVNELAAAGITIIWSTAYLEEADRCDEVVLMNEGKVVDQGTPNRLKAKISNQTFYLQHPKKSLRELLKIGLVNEEVLDIYIQGDYLRVLVSHPVKEQFFVNLFDQEIKCTVAKENLEDIFMTVAGGVRVRKSTLAGIMSDVTFDKEKPIVTAKKVTKVYGNFKAVDGVSLSIYPGKIYGLLGPNGAGKSTTFKMLCGLINPTKGECEIFGSKISKHKNWQREKMGYMAQKFSLYTTLTVMQNLEFFSGIYGLKGKEQKARINQLVELFNLTPFKSTPCNQIALGYKQRLALSCALIHQPTILFLDEPTSGVDPITRREFWVHINALVSHGVTVVITTHFMEEAEHCDYIGLILAGKLIAEGTPEELKARVKSNKNQNPTMEYAFINLVQNERNLNF